MKFIDDAIKESEQRMEENTPNKLSSDIDDELTEIMKGVKTNIFVVGAGGAGNNTISRLNEMGIEGATTIAVNTDAQDLFYSQSAKKVLLGRQTSKGLGAGGDPSVGEECAEESEDEIRDELEGSDMVFPIISKLSKKLGALTVAVATLPFSAEGIKRRENAEQGLEKLQDAADTVIIIPNDKLLEVAPNLPLNKAFMVSDEILGRAVKGITELITKKGLVSLDFADIRSIMSGSGMAMIGMGESDTGDRALESVHEALSSPLLDIELKKLFKLLPINWILKQTLFGVLKLMKVSKILLEPQLLFQALNLITMQVKLQISNMLKKKNNLNLLAMN